MPLKVAHVIAIFLSAILLPVLVRDARAQSSSPENIAKGKDLYDAAVKLMESDSYAEACPKIEEVIRLVPEGVGAKLTLGQCYEADGRLASAWISYTVAAAAAAQADQPARQKKAQDQAAALEPNLSKLTILVGEGVRSLAGLEVRHNGVLVGPELWGVPIPVDGGVHRIEATATGKRTGDKVLEIPASRAQALVEVGPFVDAQVKVAIEDPKPPPAKSPPPESAKKRIALMAAGAGLTAAGIGIGVGFHLASNGKSGDAQAAWQGLRDEKGPGACLNSGNGARCEELRNAYDGKELFRGVAIGGYVAGGALAVGTLAYILLPSSMLPRALLQEEGSTAVSGVRASVSVTLGGGGAVIEGAF